MYLALNLFWNFSNILKVVDCLRKGTTELALALNVYIEIKGFDGSYSS